MAEDVAVVQFDQIHRRHPPGLACAEQALEPLLHREQVADRVPGHMTILLQSCVTLGVPGLCEPS